MLISIFFLTESNAYVGCFVDTWKRLLPHRYRLNGADYPDMENNRCLFYCRDQGYKFAGTEDGGECFCGDNPYQYGPKNVSDYYCKATCNGDSDQICGSYWKISVYETGLLPLIQRRFGYKLLLNNTILTAPANQVLTSSGKLECAQYCSLSMNCKGFVISKETGICSLYNSFEIMCEGVQHAEKFQVFMMK
ncbi:unnamed protein product [Mytilus coruscus]|uniref:WSC domain-containing protein n=1 Tax=Mytilus coruscus TaxID=42192 RepID=A0A6J8C6H2_MYTCO|nr:unnamed protein product [Mytilus coruscus]